MNLLPKSLQSLVHELSRLPGVGERTALRYAVSLIKFGPQRIQNLERALNELDAHMGNCPCCGYWTENNICSLCEDADRTSIRMCVVRDCPDVLALEKFKKHGWTYHVLGGLLSPLAGIGPDRLNIASLMDRLKTGEIQELILAFDATVEGDATSFYLKDLLRKEFPNVVMTRTALGLPAGSSVEYLDPSTLESALQHRTVIE